MNNVYKEYSIRTIYPPRDLIFNALKSTPFKDTKVVIVGQDPYHASEAMGLSFSVNNIKLPPSLKNIYKEMYDDLNCSATTGDLSKWTKEGVLLLNATLTVVKDQPNSHAKIGWGRFTDYITSSVLMLKIRWLYLYCGVILQDLKKNL